MRHLRRIFLRFSLLFTNSKAEAELAREIAAHLALLEARVILSRVLQRFRLELAPGFAVEPMPGITLRQRNGLLMTVHPV